MSTSQSVDRHNSNVYANAYAGGLLAPVGDPLGRVLETGLKPVGSGVGALTGPVAEGAAKTTKPLMDAVGMGDRGEIKEQEKRKQEYKPLGGKPQTGENPLGL